MPHQWKRTFYSVCGRREPTALEDACALEDFGNDALRIEGGVPCDVAGDVVDVGKRLRRPAYRVVYLPGPASASSWEALPLLFFIRNWTV